MVYLNKKIVLYVLFLLLAVIHFVTTSVVRDNIFTAIENLPRPVKQTKNASLETKKSSKRKRKKFRTSGRLLGRPNPIKCSRRPKQLVDNNSGHYYFLSEDSNFKVNIVHFSFGINKLQILVLHLSSFYQCTLNVIIFKLLSTMQKFSCPVDYLSLNKRNW